MLRLWKSANVLRGDIAALVVDVGNSGQKLQDLTQGLWVKRLHDLNSGATTSPILYNFVPIRCRYVGPDVAFPCTLTIADGTSHWFNSDFIGLYPPAGTTAGNVINWTYPRYAEPSLPLYAQVDPPPGYTALSWTSPPSEIVDPSFIPCYMLSPDPVNLAHCGPVCASFPYGMGWTGDTIYAQVKIIEKDYQNGGVPIVGATYTISNVELNWSDPHQAWTGNFLSPQMSYTAGTSYVHIAANSSLTTLFIKSSDDGIISSPYPPGEHYLSYTYVTDDGSTDPFSSPLTGTPAVAGFLTPSLTYGGWKTGSANQSPSYPITMLYIEDLTKVAI